MYVRKEEAVWMISTRVVASLLFLCQWSATSMQSSETSVEAHDDTTNSQENEDNGFDATTDYSFAHPIFEGGSLSISNYLNPYILEVSDSELEETRHRLELGQVVIIRDAFAIDFAQAVYNELNERANFTLYHGSSPDGFAFHHHNIYGKENYSAFMNQTQRIFSSADTKDWMTHFLDVDCFGDTMAAPSYYAPGDFSNPHSDHTDQRTVSFIWHLTDHEQWKSEWGGALHWCLEHPDHAYMPPTFNTLILFRTQPRSQHFVTRVSHNTSADVKRLAYNGWWSSTWVPMPEDDLVDYLKRFGNQLTHQQYIETEAMVQSNDGIIIRDEELRFEVDQLLKGVYDMRYPRPRVKYEIDADHLNAGPFQLGENRRHPNLFGSAGKSEF